VTSIAHFFSEYKDALTGVSWLLVAVGWFISNGQANQREKRKETRSEVDAICKVVAEVLIKCRTYYSTPPNDPKDDERGSEIAFEVHRIVTRTERLQDRVIYFNKAVDSVGSFFDAITSAPFQSKTRLPVSAGSPKLLEIEAAVHGLIDALEESFTFSYTNPRRRWNAAIKREFLNWLPLSLHKFLPSPKAKTRH
jgi:hypothetical protein